MEKPRFFPLESRVRRTVSKYGMLSRGESVLVAVSGGADSMALLHCLRRLVQHWNLPLSVAHLNHRLRGEESDQDAAFVEDVCIKLAIPFYLEVAEVEERAAAARKNLEEIAREIRYDFLRRTALRVGARKIALGHTLNDQAETVLMRFLRGSGSEGLSAIHPVVDKLIIRPLLECTRTEILDYLRLRGILFREDTSNLDLGFRRNRVRRELIPYLEKNFNPHLADTLSTAAKVAREIAGYLELQAKAVFESLRIRDAPGTALPAPRILDLHPALQRSVVRHALRECRGNLRGVTARHVEDILHLCRPFHSGRHIKLPGGGTVVREFSNLLVLSEFRAAKLQWVYELRTPGRCLIPEAGLELVASMESRPPATAGTRPDWSRALLNPALLPEALTVRARQPGDRYGGPHHRKVKKMLIDAKIPLHRRDSLPMILAGPTIIWIPGFRPAKPYIAQPDSGRCVMIEARKMDGN